LGTLSASGGSLAPMGKHLWIGLRWLTGLSLAAAAATALAAWLGHAEPDVLAWTAVGLVGLDGVALGAFTAIRLERRPSQGVHRAATWRERHDQLAAARHLVERHGEDSIAPFIIRPDKAYAFACGGVLAYRVFGRTAVVSGDPVAPEGAASAVLESFMALARSRGWDVVVYGASGARLETYRRLGLRAVCVGEEAVVRPAAFSLEGRRVRKLRQSVHRMQRRGWQIAVHDGIEIDSETEAEINQLEARWRAEHPRMLGFAMSMGRFETGIAPADLYLLARSPDGRLAATMRFISHRGKLSLDTMRRVGETPNGLNEALVCRALEVARERGVPEVSLNYAGLAHLIRRPRRGGWLRRRGIGLAMAILGHWFQMERLVCFNEKFFPEWRPRYLVYPSRRALPRAVYRVLQAEGYLSAPRPPATVRPRRRRNPVLPVNADAPGQ
jgi:lysyl-tRNA synthetase class 2